MKTFFNSIRDQYVQLAIFMLFMMSVFILVFLFPRQTKFQYQYTEGEVWKQKPLIAPFDFTILKTDGEIEKDKLEIKLNSPIYYVLNNDTKNIPIEKLKIDIRNNWSDSNKSIDKTGPIKGLFINTEKDADNIEHHISIGVSILTQCFDKGVFDLYSEHELQGEDHEFVLINEKELLTLSFSDILTYSKAINFSKKLLQKEKNIDRDFLLTHIQHNLKYNVVYDKVKTDKTLASNISNIVTKKGKIKEGERIITTGEVITFQKVQILKSYKYSFNQQSRNSSKFWMIIIGQLLLVSLCMIVVYFFIKLFEPSILAHAGQVFFILLLFVLVTLLAKLSLDIEELNVYLVPICIFPIILRAFYKVELAVFLHIILVFVISFMVVNPYEFIILHVIAGALLVFGINNQTRRSQFLNSAIMIFVSYAITYFGITLIKTGDLNSINWFKFSWFGGNAMLSLFAYPLIYLFEKTFGLLSEISLVELADTNSPLLRKLNEKAPGTFVHSLQVASLAEEAVRKINGNSLLVRAGAMYHDIGKMVNPEFFIENQSTNYNPHNDLDYDESAKIIIGHVIHGIEIAKKHNLPDQLLNFIRTHHGTSKVEYFYRMKIKEVGEENVNPEDYMYPGPLPFSKETAVLMMADSVEAASRSINDITAEKIDALIEKIITFQMNSGQFLKADITFKDITLIKQIFSKKLKNIYHVRVEYPE